MPIFGIVAKLPVMSTMNISLPDELKVFVDQQVASRGYTSSSEYVRELLRRERDREKLRGLLMEGLESGPAREIDLDAWEAQLHTRIRQRATKMGIGLGRPPVRKSGARAR